jgi:hypothetical protein
MSVLSLLETICCEWLVLWNTARITEIICGGSRVPACLIAGLALVAMTETGVVAGRGILSVWTACHGVTKR